MLIFNRAKQDFLNNWWWSIDKILFSTILLLMLIGLILIISTSPFIASRIGVRGTYFINNHIIYLGMALSILAIMSFLSKEIIVKLAIVMFVISLLLIIGILLVGDEIKGAKRWVYFFNVSIQPSEFAKVSFPIVIATLWDKFYLKTSLSSLYFVSFLLYLVVILLLLMQPDIGMVMLITAIFAVIIFVSGINIVFILFLFIIGIAFLIFTYFNFSHVSYRIDSFFSEQKSYQVLRAIDAIQNGKIFGVGAGNGVVKAYLPDSHTDFIFSVLLEELGLLFAFIVLGLYLIILLKIYTGIIQKKYNIFFVMALSGIATLLSTQILIHVASNVNLMPTKGMTLPLLSYGGSSLVSTAFLIGIILAFTKKDTLID